MQKAMHQQHKTRNTGSTKHATAMAALGRAALPQVGTGTLSLALAMTPVPSRAQPLECTNANIKIVGGVVFCTKNEKTSKDPCESQGPQRAETVFIIQNFHLL
jgi:hypothetical protein